MLLLQDQFICEPLGASELRGHSRMSTFAVVGPVDSASPLPASLAPTGG
jgi:hypothetical protein